MFYWPYKFRSQTEYLVPRGPGFTGAPVLRTKVNGNEITIKIPRHKSHLSVKPINPKRTYFIRDNDFGRYIASKPEWEYFPLIARWLDFNGPWFTGNLGSLDVFVGVLRRLRSAPGRSLFHPRAFESTIADFMTFCHGHELSRNKSTQDWYAPVDWKALKRFQCVAAKFDAITNAEVRRSERCRYLFLPISDHYLLQISCSITRVLPFVNSKEEPEDDTDKWISEEPMKALADQILDSLQVRLSPEVEEQQAIALKQLGGEAQGLVEKFAPLKWV